MKNSIIRPAYLILLFIFSAKPSFSQHPLVSLHKDARASWLEGDFTTYEKLSSQILAWSKDPAVALRRSVALSALGRSHECERILADLVACGLTYKVDTIGILQKKLGNEKLNFWNASFQNNLHSKDNSDTVAVLPDSHLIPEGITNNKNGQLLIGSLAQWKIISLKKDRVSEFIKTGHGGMWSVVGIKCYQPANELWVCSASEVDSAKGSSGLFCFDLTTGQIKNRFVVGNTDGEHFFNDLDISSGGDVFLTDSKAGTVFLYDRERNSFAPYLKAFVYPNGIALDEKRKKMYVADATGIQIVDLSDKSLSSLSDGGITYTTGIDGLYFFNGDLVAIQDTGLQDDRVVRFSMKGDTIRKVAVLQGMRQDFKIPTTGTFMDGYFYYIANSQLRNLKPDMGFVDEDQLAKSVILRLKID